MRHRHLNHGRYSLAAIDDVTARGRWTEWANLRRAVRADPSLLDRATRDYVDFAAVADRIGYAATAEAFVRFDVLYPQPSGESALQQMLAQLASPKPYDLDGTTLAEYRHLEARWHDWEAIRTVCVRASTVIFDHVCDLDEARAPRPA